MKRIALVLSLAVVMASAERSAACSWAVGHFHQVRSLKGRVVGANLHSWGPLQALQYIRSLRQSTRSGAVLTLYEYRWPIRGWSELSEVTRRITDNKGRFDFGDIENGHYILVIQVDKEWSDQFDVEITTKVPKTKQITIDVSPVYPDCKGGHEFIVETGS